ncbi:bacteriohemerythrin [Cyanobacterium sp. Dongsha4]|uniref:bacteriohemerythrin n=1 Tax=Cyanobacterium sp. DS4 TaxID=2878255 RepID=UPI002E82430B|nr:bacteriohemerythrin [Cyanobacterium sp. Dongsha4]WVK99682.1 bacteriohemerythrin [Cyanobacterium sp. Dongsha4]
MNITIAKWRSEYNTGDSIVDEQHQSLFCIINSLNSAMLEGQGTKILRETIESLKEYTNIHFETEEEYMLHHQYPGYEEHKKIHESLKQKVLQFEQTLNHDSHRLTIPLSYFLTEWLTKHIKGEDMKMILYCREKSYQKKSSDLIEVAHWQPRYETGFHLIDAQHQSLFHAINALNNAMLAGRGEQLLENTLKALSNYTRIHFETEEEYMRKFNYEDYENHHLKHNLLRKKVDSFLSQKESVNKTKLTIDVSHFLTDWLINHIKKEDLKMIAFLKEKKQELCKMKINN